MMDANGELDGEIAGRFRYTAQSKADYPGVGDWVVLRPDPGGGTALIQDVLPRRSCLRRKMPGSRSEDQVIASNLDVVLVVCGLDGGRNLNLRRVERYLVLIREGGAQPVVVLNKTDLCPDPAPLLEQVRAAAADSPVLATSATAGEGLDALQKLLSPGVTGALVGPSGVGKSSLLNALAGEERLATSANRAGDYRGRHTTTHRELILLPNGGILIDTPGLRELQLWGDGDQAVDDAFRDIDDLARDCRFADCTHQDTPGCAVSAAIEQGALAADRLDSYHRLKRELAFLNRRRDKQAQLNTKARWKQITKAYRKQTRPKK